jgi:subtilase family serine protease
MGHQPTRRRVEVQAIAKRHQADLAGLQLLKQPRQPRHRSTKPIQPPDYDTLNLPRQHIGPQAAPSRPNGGGGSSVYESAPRYQRNYGIKLSGRGTPDVAMDADPNTGVSVYDSTGYGGQTGWFAVGGTSASTPMWAGVVALADQSRSLAKKGPLSSANLTGRFDYNAATGTAYGSNYYDITIGSNGHPTATGYDLATGLGTPQANNLVRYLASH